MEVILNIRGGIMQIMPFSKENYDFKFVLMPSVLAPNSTLCDNNAVNTTLFLPTINLQFLNLFRCFFCILFCGYIYD